MMHTRRRVQEKTTSQMQQALAGAIGAKAWRSVSKDGEDVRPGRMFHVEGAEHRMEFGYDRIGDPGKDRPALMLRHWKDAVWFGLPSSLVAPVEPGKFTIPPDSWINYRRPDAPREQYVFWWYESVISEWLYNPLGDVKPELLERINCWVAAWHSKRPARLANLSDDRGEAQ